MKHLSIILVVLALVFGVNQPVLAKAPSSKKNQNVSAVKVQKININTASAEQLTSLKGIGPKKAQAIIEFRKKNGKFKKLEDLMLVKGIGKKTFEKIKPYLTL